MAEQKKQTKTKKENKNSEKHTKKQEEKNTSTNEEQKKNEQVTEKKTETKNTKETKKEVKKEKTVAVARGVSLRISPKYAAAICKFIKGKTPETAIEMLTEVSLEKRPVPMAALEVAHQKGKGIAGAKYPKTAAIAIKEIITQVRANAVVNSIENPIITLAKADRATAPFRSGGKRAKRAHVRIEVQDKTKMKKKQEQKK